MSKFKYDDVVRVRSSAAANLRPGAIAWVIAIFSDRPKGRHFEKFPPGVIYTIEYEDGSAVDIEESDIEPAL